MYLYQITLSLIYPLALLSYCIETAVFLENEMSIAEILPHINNNPMHDLRHHNVTNYLQIKIHQHVYLVNLSATIYFNIYVHNMCPIEYSSFQLSPFHYPVTKCEYKLCVIILSFLSTTLHILPHFLSHALQQLVG